MPSLLALSNRLSHKVPKVGTLTPSLTKHALHTEDSYRLSSWRTQRPLRQFKQPTWPQLPIRVQASILLQNNQQLARPRSPLAIVLQPLLKHAERLLLLPPSFPESLTASAALEESRSPWRGHYTFSRLLTFEMRHQSATSIHMPNTNDYV